MWFLVFFFSLTATAAPVLHFIRPQSSFTQIGTLEACTTFTHSSDKASCNPGLFPYQKDQGVRMGLATITDGESVEVGQKLLLDPIKEDFLRRLFAKQSFNSWGANSFIELRSSKFTVAYDPLLINADVFVFNPASPEVAMSLIKSNRLRFTSGVSLGSVGPYEISAGATVFYFRNQVYQDSFFLSDLAGTDVDEIIRFKKQNGVSGDIGTLFRSENSLLPHVSLLVRNLNAPLQIDEGDVLSETELRPLLTHENFSRVGLGYEIKGSWGAVNGELNLPFDGTFESYYSEYVSLGLGYTLSRFSAYAGLAKYQQVLGMDFGSKIATVGIFYGQARPLGDFSEQTEHLAGLRGQVNL